LPLNGVTEMVIGSDAPDVCAGVNGGRSPESSRTSQAVSWSPVTMALPRVPLPVNAQSSALECWLLPITRLFGSCVLMNRSWKTPMSMGALLDSREIAEAQIQHLGKIRSCGRMVSYSSVM
jgi:hypothetical protein